MMQKTHDAKKNHDMRHENRVGKRPTYKSRNQVRMPDDIPMPHFANRADFSAFVDEHYDRIFSHAWRMLGNREDAEDLTQEICLSLPRKLAGFRGECKMTTWLYRLVNNAVIDVLRKNRRMADRASECNNELLRQAEEGRERTKRQNWLLRSFADLPDDLRITASLVVESGMSQTEVAASLDVAPGTVAWRMSEIRKRLRCIERGERDVV